MFTITARRAAAIATALALTATPAVATASTHSSKIRSQAEKFCRAQRTQEGVATFDAQYGKKNAFGKCVSAYEKTHSSKGKKKGHAKTHGKGKKKGHSK